MSKKFSQSFTPFAIGGLTIKNRYCMAPMGTYNFIDGTGAHTADAMEYYIERARGGFGLLFTGSFFTDLEVDAHPEETPHKIISPLQTPDTFRASSIELNERLAVYGTKMFAQLTMGVGRNFMGMKAPSAMDVYGHPGVKAEALTRAEIKSKIKAVIQGAILMQQSGFAGVEIHSIHWGYLLDQFAQSWTNQRDDEYGGSLENRLRITKEVVEGIKEACGQDFPVTMRLSIKSYMKESGTPSLDGSEEFGRTIEEGAEVARLLEEYGYDAINVDTGMYESYYYAVPPMYMKRGYMVALVEELKKKVSIPILTGSHMNDPEMAEKAVKDGIIDGIVIGRGAIADPMYPRKLQKGAPEQIRPCIACNIACVDRLLFNGVNFSCAVNPSAGRELRYALKPNFLKKELVVVGGGVAGMEVARSATLRGHHVTLFEEKSVLGGHLIPGGSHNFKQEVSRLNKWYQRELAKLKVDIRLNQRATKKILDEMNPDAVILASGSVPIKPNITGVDHASVRSSIQALNSPEEIGERVMVVGGGLVGCEIALEYAEEGKQVTIVEAQSEILAATGAPTPYPNKLMLQDLLAHHQVEMLTNHQLEAVTDDGAVVKDVAGTEATSKVLEVDNVVIAVGFKSVRTLEKQFADAPFEVYQIGDERHVSTIQNAIWDAYEVARSI